MTDGTTTMDMAALLAEIESLKAANVALAAGHAKGPRALTLKVSEKGCLSVYGLGRFPVTLYRGQWERLIGAVDQIKAFIEANVSTLKTKE